LTNSTLGLQLLSGSRISEPPKYRMVRKPAQFLEKLPNAPLVEAVFELRWAVQPGIAYADPGFPALREAFSKQAKRLGFVAHRDMAPPDLAAAPHSVARRFYVAEDKDFPLMQIGPGIFAANESVEYNWAAFRKQVVDGVRLLLETYPKLSSFPFTPTYLELRYVDAFDASLIDTSDLIEFLNQATTLKLELPEVFTKIGSIGTKGRLILQTALKQRKDSYFIFDIGSGTRNAGDDIVRMETKVHTGAGGVPKVRAVSHFLKELDRWLEFAHQHTSPFFKGFVTTKVMDTFRGAH
jgi:uncharacterized protein (TIGR04255 family)